MGSFEVDICRICHMLWVDAEEHVEIPHPEDFINERGDSTRTKDWGDASATLTMENEKDESAFSEVPDSMAKIVLNFFGLPHEDHHRDVPTHVWITGFIIVACALLFAPFTLRHPEIIKEYGFYPGDPLKNHGLNILFGPLLHAGFVHLIYNLYFFGILADDVEERLGFFRYGAFVLFTFGFVAMSQIIWGTHPDVPHIGLSGLVMAVMTFYTLEFPKSRLVYMVPWIHSMHFQRGGYARIRGLRWLRIKIGWVALGYLAVDVLSYFLLERNGLTSVSHTAHISGAVIGAILWGALRPLRQMRPLKAANSQKDK
ncbi:MAG: rhomboid family intramembrane serine protease [Pseudobdellovibrionaceae bacterium]|nr:MAG: rhomboid family intramembrane serine protease [Pseudobdellovibrionaceae bacterium]